MMKQAQPVNWLTSIQHGFLWNYMVKSDVPESLPLSKETLQAKVATMIEVISEESGIDYGNDIIPPHPIIHVYPP